MEVGEDLFENVKEFYSQAEKALKEKAYNSSSTLYFKALAVLIDYFILKKEGYIPSNHAERFRLLEKKYPVLYQILDKNFPVYQKSYRTKLTREHLEVFKSDFKKVVEFTGFEVY